METKETNERHDTLEEIIADLKANWENNIYWKDAVAARAAAGITPREQVLKVIDVLENAICLTDGEDRAFLIRATDNVRTWDTRARLMRHTVPAKRGHTIENEMISAYCMMVGRYTVQSVEIKWILFWVFLELSVVSNRLQYGCYEQVDCDHCKAETGTCPKRMRGWIPENGIYVEHQAAIIDHTR